MPTRNNPLHKIAARSRRIILTMLAAGALWAKAEEKQVLTLHTIYCDEIVYYLDSTPKMKFQGQTIEITSESGSSQIPMDDILRWTIETREYDSITDVLSDSDKVKISIFPGELYVSQVHESTVSIYSIDGKKIASKGGREIKFALPSGIFIIQTSSRTYKVNIR